MKIANRNSNISLSILLCAVTLHWLSFTGLAQPHYVQVGTNLPLPSASDRVEVFDATSQQLFSFPTYNNGGYVSDGYVSHQSSNDTFGFTKLSGLASVYWGRVASDGTNVFAVGGYGVNAYYIQYVPITSVPQSPAWQTTTAIPRVDAVGRALHQTFIYQGKLYVLGGWHGDQFPAFSDVYYAPILTGGSLGSFVPTTSLPTGMAAHSATVSADGKVYLARGTNLYVAQIAADGSMGGWVRQPTIAGMNHGNSGNTGIALVNDLLIIVDATQTFVCQLNGSGQLDSTVTTITNPALFTERSVFVSNGKVYVTATTGKMYRIDGLPFSSGACAPTPSGMIAWWPGDKDGTDIVGGNNGTLVNGVSFAPGVVGQAFSFDGGAKTGISVPDTKALELTNSLTIEAWVKITALTNTIDGMILFRGDDRGGLDPYALAISGGSTAAVFHVCASLTSEFGITAPVPFGPFFQLAATLDGSSGQMSLYVNGSLAAQLTTTVRPFGDLDPTANPGVGIGNIQGLPLSVYSSPFRGLIDDLRVYSKALSASEIKAIADAGVQGLCPAVPLRTATASAVVTNGFIIAATITDGGYAYTNTPTVRIIGEGESGAQAVAVVSNGVVIAVNILDAGYGYLGTPLIVIDPPFIPNPVLSIAPMSFLTFSNLTLGGVYQLQRWVAWYWSNQPISFTATNALYAQMVAGTAGSGDYRLALNPVPAQAFASAQMVNGFVVGATVTSGGSGYVNSPAITIVGGGGTNATAVSHMSGGIVTGITITDAGIGYTNTPTIRIAPPPAAAVSPTVSPVMRVDSSSLAPYNNYQLQFKPDLAGTWGNWIGGLFTPTGTTSSQFLFVTNSVGFFRVSYVP